MGQIDLFKNYLYLIELCAKKIKIKKKNKRIKKQLYKKYEYEHTIP